jgi:hypothetical protein
MPPQPPSPPQHCWNAGSKSSARGESSLRSREPFCVPSVRDSALCSVWAAPRCHASSGPRDASRRAGRANISFIRARNGARMLCLNPWFVKLCNTVPAVWWAWLSTILV